jgi:hypothetical protein
MSPQNLDPKDSRALVLARSVSPELNDRIGVSLTNLNDVYHEWNVKSIPYNIAQAKKLLEKLKDPGFRNFLIMLKLNSDLDHYLEPTKIKTIDPTTLREVYNIATVVKVLKEQTSDELLKDLSKYSSERVSLLDCNYVSDFYFSYNLDGQGLIWKLEIAKNIQLFPQVLTPTQAAIDYMVHDRTLIHCQRPDECKKQTEDMIGQNVDGWVERVTEQYGKYKRKK